MEFVATEPIQSSKNIEIFYCLILVPIICSKKKKSLSPFFCFGLESLDVESCAFKFDRKLMYSPKLIFLNQLTDLCSHFIVDQRFEPKISC